VERLSRPDEHRVAVDAPAVVLLREEQGAEADRFRRDALAAFFDASV